MEPQISSSHTIKRSGSHLHFIDGSVITYRLYKVKGKYSIIRSEPGTIAIHKKLQQLSLQPSGDIGNINIAELGILMDINKVLLQKHLNILKDLHFARLSGNYVRLTETGMKASTPEEA